MPETVVYECNGQIIESRHVPRLFRMIEENTGLDEAIAKAILLAGNPIKHPMFEVRARRTK
jgi:hypothetical protein